MNKKLFQGQLLNCIAFFVPAVIFVYIFVSGARKDTYGPAELPDSGELIEKPGTIQKVITGIGNSWLTPFMVILTLIFVLGVVICLMKSRKTRLILSYIYLIAAIIHVILFAIRLVTYDAVVLFLWVLGVILLLPGILQIVAGTKFIAGAES